MLSLTGARQRLNRETLNESYRFGDLNYAKEELRAELASVFLMAERGIPHNPDSQVTFECDLRPVPSSKCAPTQSAGCARLSDQVDRPAGIRLPCNIPRNRRLSNGYRQTTDFSHDVKRYQKVKKK